MTDLFANVPNNSIFTIPPGDWGDQVIVKKTGLTVNASPGASVRSLYINASTNIDISIPINWYPDANTTPTTNALRVYNSSDIVIHDMKIAGKLVDASIPNALDPNATPQPGMNSLLIGYPAGRGADIEYSKYVTVRNCDISGFFRGVVIAKVSNFTATDNKTHNLRTTHWSGGGNDTFNLLFARNYMLGSKPYRYFDGTKMQGDHSDGIHFWTTKGGTPIDNIKIVDCFFDQADSDPTTVFNLEDYFEGATGFTNVIIRGNTAINGGTQGMTLGGPKGGIAGIVVGNVMISPVDAIKWPTFILYGDTSKLAISSNTAADLSTKPPLAATYPANVWLPRATTAQGNVNDARARGLARLTDNADKIATLKAQIADLQAQLAILEKEV